MRSYLFIFFLLLSNLTYAQIVISPISSPISSPVSRPIPVLEDEEQFDPALIALLAKGEAEEYDLPSATVQGYLNTLIVSLKADGIWDKLDVLYVFATDGDSDFATLNLIDPDNFQCTKVNSPTFTSLEGFTFNGSDNYINTNYDGLNNSDKYTLNEASFSLYIRNNANDGIHGFFDNTQSSPNRGSAIFDFRSNYIGYGPNSDGPENYASNPGNGWFTITRKSATELEMYENGSQVGVTKTNNATQLSNKDFYIGCRNLGGSPNSYNSDQVSVVAIGGDISEKQGDFFDAIEDYMDSNNKGVFF